MKVVSVNRAQARPVLMNGRRVMTAIGKQAVEVRVTVGRLGLEGDEQADLSVHGGLSKAVYAYGLQHYGFWQTVRAQAQVSLWEDALAPGSLGENLSIDRLDEGELWVGDQLHLPDCVLAVSEPRFPCGKFNAVMGFAQASKMMVQSGWCGSYLAVIAPGTVGAGDAVRLEPGPRAVSLRELFKARARA
jgi:MOSC domain-containing protein YiiM